MTPALYINWNAAEGIDLGFFMIRFYSLMFVVAFGLGWYITKKIYEREGETMEKLDTLFVWTVLATLVGARLGHVFFYDWKHYRNHLSEILLPFRFDPTFEFTGFQGLASHGATIGIIVTLFFYNQKILKRGHLWILDRVVIPVASGAIFVRIGNFFNSEILGKATTSEFGVRFVKDFYSKQDAVNLTHISNPKEAYSAITSKPEFAKLLQDVPVKHPAQLYESFAYIFVFAILYFLYWKTDVREKKGFLFGLFLILLWSVRFVVDFVKESQGGFGESLGTFSTGQWLSIPFILIGFYFVVKAKKPII